MENWKDITGTSHEVSDRGNIRNKRTGRILKQSSSTKGYARVSLSNGGGKTPTIIFPHRLVAQSFIPNPENKPQVNHKNSNRMDPRIENLEWVTAKENTKHAMDTGKMDAKAGSVRANLASLPKVSNPTVAVNILTGEKTYYPSRSECSRKLNIPYTTMSRAVTNKTSINNFIIE